MRWPLVSLAEYEATRVERDNWKRTAEVAADVNHQLIMSYKDLLEKYHALANPPAPTPTPATQVPHQEPSFVATIIRDQSKHDPRLAAYLKHYATQLKADGMTEDEIGMALTQWTTTEPLES